MSLAMQVPHDFGFGEEHDLLRKGARRFLEENGGAEVIRRLIEQPGAFDEPLHRRIAELGWIGLTLPDDVGGAGLGWLHLALVLDEMGQALLPSPFLPSVLAAIAIDRAGSGEQRSRWLPSLVEGRRIATVAFCELEPNADPLEVKATAGLDGDRWVLRGTKTHVMAGGIASTVVAPFREADGAIRLYAVDLDADHVEVEPEDCIDPTRPTSRVTFEAAVVGPEARLDAGDAQAVADLWLRARILLAAEMLGGAERVMDMTREYARERVQFGRAIGSFQAVKHPIVDTMIGVEQLRSLVYGAAACLDAGGEDADVLSRMAKALASELYPLAVRKGVQLHGGFGFTWECDVHLWFRRAMWSRPMLGDATHHRAVLGRRLLG